MEKSKNKRWFVLGIILLLVILVGVFITLSMTGDVIISKNFFKSKFTSNNGSYIQSTKFGVDNNPFFVISSQPGQHSIWIGEENEKTEVIYYIPKNFDKKTAEYWFLIHGAGFCHRAGALAHIDQWTPVAERENLVLVAPVFDRIYYNSEGTQSFDIDSCKTYESYCGDHFGQRYSLKCFDYPYPSPRSYLWDFVYMLSTEDSARQDKKVLEIFDYFNSKLVKKNTFNIYGHSGGGQFVARFMMLYPEKLSKVGVSASGTMMFPDTDGFPFGTNFQAIPRHDWVFNGNQNPLDLLNISSSVMESKISRLLGLNVLLVVGDQDSVGNCHENPTASWQGCYDYDKMRNYYGEMKNLYYAHYPLQVVSLNKSTESLGNSTPNLGILNKSNQKSLGIGNSSLSKTHLFKMKYSLLPGVGHDNVANGNYAINYFYPPSQNCEDSDGGKNYLVKGYTTKGLDSEEDHCWTINHPNVLIEFYCDNNEIKFESKDCISSCNFEKGSCNN